MCFHVDGLKRWRTNDGLKLSGGRRIDRRCGWHMWSSTSARWHGGLDRVDRVNTAVDQVKSEVLYRTWRPRGQGPEVTHIEIMGASIWSTLTMNVLMIWAPKTTGERFPGLGLKTRIEFQQELDAACGIIIKLSLMWSKVVKNYEWQDICEISNYLGASWKYAKYHVDKTFLRHVNGKMFELWIFVVVYVDVMSHE